MDFPESQILNRELFSFYVHIITSGVEEILKSGKTNIWNETNNFAKALSKGNVVFSLKVNVKFLHYESRKPARYLIIFLSCKIQMFSTN